MTLQEVRNYFGSWRRMARVLNISPRTHRYWHKIGYIPMTRQLMIERETNGKLKSGINFDRNEDEGIENLD